MKKKPTYIDKNGVTESGSDFKKMVETNRRIAALKAEVKSNSHKKN